MKRTKRFFQLIWGDIKPTVFIDWELTVALGLIALGAFTLFFALASAVSWLTGIPVWACGEEVASLLVVLAVFIGISFYLLNTWRASCEK